MQYLKKNLQLSQSIGLLMVIQHRYEETIPTFQTYIRDQKMLSAYLIYINGTAMVGSPLSLHHSLETYPIIGGFSDSN